MPTIFLIGGTGFIGSVVLTEALGRGYQVRALARSETAAAALGAAGAEVVRGNAHEPTWINHARGADVLIDLVQPPLPKRMSRRAMRAVAAERARSTDAQLAALLTLSPGERPVYFSISGADDLEPDGRGTINHDSQLRSANSGFAIIGVPVRKLVEASGVEAAYVHFGVMVYGPGKGFADFYVRGLRNGRAAVIGSGENRLPLTHVSDAAQALVHLAGLPREQLIGRTFLAADGSGTTQGEFLDQTANLMGARRPRRLPVPLVGLIGGPVAAEAMTFNAAVDNSALLATGFEFRYPSPHEGLPQVLAALGEMPTTGSA